MDIKTLKQIYSILDKAYVAWQAPIITLIAERGGSPFEVLISTILSLRTKDEVTAVTYKRLAAEARSPRKMWGLGEARIAELIYPSGFYKTKAANIVKICRILIDKYDGNVPDSMEELLELPNVGRKTANLVLAEGFGRNAMCVDTHVHRISNRFDFVQTKTPEKTEMALRQRLPVALWSRFNTILVAFGQTICRPVSPFCDSKCPVRDLCPRRGVETHR